MLQTNTTQNIDGAFVERNKLLAFPALSPSVNSLSSFYLPHGQHFTNAKDGADCIACRQHLVGTILAH